MNFCPLSFISLFSITMPTNDINCLPSIFGNLPQNFENDLYIGKLFIFSDDLVKIDEEFISNSKNRLSQIDFKCRFVVYQNIYWKYLPVIE